MNQLEVTITLKPDQERFRHRGSPQILSVPRNGYVDFHADEDGYIHVPEQYLQLALAAGFVPVVNTPGAAL